MLRKNIIKLPEPSGKKEGTTGTGDPLKMLILGDSSAAGVGVDLQDEALLGHILKNPSDSYEITYRLIAKTGARTQNSINRLKREPDSTFDIGMSALGVNDLTAGLSVEP